VNYLKIILAAFVISGLLLTGCAQGNPGGPRVGQPAADFQLSDLKGQKVSLSSTKGKPVLLNFWATTCQPCRNEMPFLQAIYNDWADKGLVLLEINMGETSSTVSDYLQSNNLNLPILLDTEMDVAGKYSVQYIPTTYLINKDGIIQNKIIGAFSDKSAIESYVTKMVP
jgi:peroxiredoxin